MAEKLLGILRADVEMMLGKMGFVGIFKGFSILYSKITFVLVADPCKSFDYLVKNRAVTYNNVYINARLCAKVYF